MCAAALLSAACNEERSRPGLEPEPSVASDSASAVVYGRVLQRDYSVAAGARVGAVVRRQDCTGEDIARIPGTNANAFGAYWVELTLKLEPFRGCVVLEVDATPGTSPPDTIVQLPDVQFRRFPPERDSVRLDVMLMRP
ncbi:MAG TPA: hypothetical protein VIL18_07665 [Longimicrobiales bacterium]